MTLPQEWHLCLPDWALDTISDHQGPYDDEGAMALAIDLGREGAAHGVGGPFGAAVITSDNGLVAAGANLVFASGASVAHAEIVALTLAQQRLGDHDLGAHGALTLVSSAEPCAMCLGALPWSGIRRLVCGARDADVRAVGFDEGAKPAGWVEALTTRGIGVARDVLRAEARQVLAEYRDAGRALY